MTLTEQQHEEVKYGLRMGDAHELSNRPFYWNSYHREGSAPSGWYQLTPSGIVYLGESILERAS